MNDTGLFTTGDARNSVDGEFHAYEAVAYLGNGKHSHGILLLAENTISAKERRLSHCASTPCTLYRETRTCLNEAFDGAVLVRAITCFLKMNLGFRAASD